VTVPVTDTLLQKQRINRSAAQNFTSVPAQVGTPLRVLPVGGIPASRAFIEFLLPPYYRDSAVIIRATLEMTTSEPLFGIPADSTFIEARPLLADLGPKSPVAGDVAGGLPIVSGMSDINIEIVSLVKLWQGRSPLPPIVRLGLTQEGGTFLTPLIRSTGAVTGRPRLHLTYRPRLAFESF
jgi:hypothetical protein